ncbi:MAG TPA: PP2C family serine/threonine-protein phosphatase [Blastocatellia bacterium]|nr:PP2C family serine/threonine-protein phosphatase [Blastocatellia bacterium]
MLKFWKKTPAKKPAAAPAPGAPRPTWPGTNDACPPAVEVTAGLLSDPGCARLVNEDRCYYRQPDDRELLAGKGVLALVADGIGGHAAGEIASSKAVEIIARVYYESDRPPQAALEEAFHAANRAIHQAARQNDRLHGMGTTCTALVIREGTAYSAQVGDSRLYLVRGGEIFLMSEDHSAVMEMVRQGRMTLEDARRHADKNIILRALGTQPEVRVATWKTSFPVRDGDHFVLCSDGLYDLVTDEEIRGRVTAAEPHPACEKLIALARERGGHDNITVGVLRVRLADAEAEDESATIRETRESKLVVSEQG